MINTRIWFRVTRTALRRHITVQAAAVSRKSSKQLQQEAIDRLLVTKSAQPRTSFESLPHLFECPDLLTNARLAPLVTPIDSRLLVPFYADVDRNNSGLNFYQAGGEEDDYWRSHYVRSFMPHCISTKGSPNLFYVNASKAHLKELPWQGLSSMLVEVFASIGVSVLRDFYTHILPPLIGRHLPHRDQIQSNTWKVDIRFSPEPTELLVLDEQDGRWYALRFPAGGSGYILCSSLLVRFHAVRAGSAIQQSVLAVFHKHGSTLHMVRQALAQRASGTNPVEPRIGPFETFPMPPAPTRHPRSADEALVGSQAAKHIQNCLESLHRAVLAIDPRQSSLSRVPRSVLDQAFAALPTDTRDEVHSVYEQNLKMPQLANYGAYQHTPARVQSKIEGGKKNQEIVDTCHISLHGTAIVGNKTFHFPEYDGTEDTRLRFAWTRRGDVYVKAISAESGNRHIKTLASLAGELNLSRDLSVSWWRGSIRFNVVEGDTITGQTAELLRGVGLTLRVVPVDGDLDHKTKRLRELERSAATRALRQKRPPGFPKSQTSAWGYFMQDFCRPASRAFAELGPSEKKAYQDQAAAEHSLWLSNKLTSPKRPRSVWQFYFQDYCKLAKQSFNQLSPRARKVYQDQAVVDQRRYETQVSEWRLANPPALSPVTAYQVYCVDMSPVLERQHPAQYSGNAGSMKLRRDLKSEWQRLGPTAWLEYERRARASEHLDPAVMR